MISVGNSQFTDLIYMDDMALLVQLHTAAVTCPSSFSEVASTLGLHISWPKTNVQNVGAGGMCGEFCVLGQCPAIRRSVTIRHQKMSCLVCDGSLVEDIVRLSRSGHTRHLFSPPFCMQQRHGPCMLKMPGSLRAFT